MRNQPSSSGPDSPYAINRLTTSPQFLAAAPARWILRAVSLGVMTPVVLPKPRRGGTAKTLLFACRSFPLSATVRENGCVKQSLGHLQEDALLAIAPRSFCPVHALVRELPKFLRRHDAAPIRAMNCRISGELFE
jgi:hypothetical protein